MINIAYATKEADTVLIRGDAIQSLKEMEDNSIDSIVTDPPYGLSFMGKKWDYDVPSVDLWKEVFRVLKHGGHLLSFAGTRTYHRMAVNIEEAGFEIRDMISWLYGSGFPKSLNIGKQVDKIQGNEREVVGEKSAGMGTGKTFGMLQSEGYNSNKELNKGVVPVTKGNSPWEGYGTALKPACEPIVVARKPLSEKNIALNVLKHGTGGINIDGCRINFRNEEDEKESKGKNQHSKYPNSIMRNPAPNGIYHEDKRPPQDYTAQGRFPANIILDEEAGKILDEQSGVVHGGLNKTQATSIFGSDTKNRTQIKRQCDKGGASRFFYCAKASKSERNFGLDDFEEKVISDRNPECYSADVPNNRSANPMKNHHPTVKPIKLMQYLVRLVTPKGAICLDPFMGSGTTGIACIKEGIKFVGIEREEEYLKIATARIEASRSSKDSGGQDG